MVTGPGVSASKIPQSQALYIFGLYIQGTNVVSADILQRWAV